MLPRSLSILIVEDDAAARDTLCNLIALQYPAMQIHCAENGQSGFDSFIRHSPDLVVTDLSMPVMDGISMAAEIRTLNRNIAVIALTSYSDARFLLKSIEIGIDHYLVKPLVCEKLFAILDKNIALITESSQRKQMELALLKSQEDLKIANELLEQR